MLRLFLRLFSLGEVGFTLGTGLTVNLIIKRFQVLSPCWCSNKVFSVWELPLNILPKSQNQVSAINAPPPIQHFNISFLDFNQ